MGNVDEEVCTHFGTTLARELQPRNGLVPTLLTCKNDQAVSQAAFDQLKHLNASSRLLSPSSHAQDVENERRLAELGQVLLVLARLMPTMV